MIEIFLTTILIILMSVDAIIAMTIAGNIVYGNVNRALNLLGPATVLTAVGFIVAVVHDWLIIKK